MSSSEAESKTFASLIDEHMRNGTRPNVRPHRPGKRWTNKELAGRLGIDEKTVRNWKNGSSAPVDLGALEAEFFGGNADYDEQRLELRLAFDRTKGMRPAATRSGALARQPCNLPFATLGHLFKGRDAVMDDLRAALLAHNAAAVAGKALHGLGGVGKTRLAIEYAWRHAVDYTALLFVPAESPARLETSLSALAGQDILNLPENEAPQDRVKIAAVLSWLNAHPGWLIILDNVDDADAVKSAANLMVRLKGGHLLITGRATKFPPHVGRFELSVLDEDPATEFLLARTEDGRFHAPDDADNARALAHEMGGLALGLEQAGAYIANEQIGFSQYLKLWRETREEALAWFDKDLMAYDHADGLATTWEISVRRLGPHGLRLLERLAFFSPEPIPDSLLDVRVDGDDLDARKGRSELVGLSLISTTTVRAGIINAPGFAVHRLVQAFAARRIGKDRHEVLQASLNWVNSGYVGDLQEIPTRRMLDSLLPHAVIIVDHADKAKIGEPTARLMNEIGALLKAKARYLEAIHWTQRAFAISEELRGLHDPKVATCLNNLAALYQDQNHFSEAEPLYRRALSIFEEIFGLDHPEVARVLNNLAQMLVSAKRFSEAEPLFRRALSIEEVPPASPKMATLNNLAGLLLMTNRPSEAEPLFRQALTIAEATHNPNHPAVANSLNNLAELLRRTGRFSEAEPLSKRHLEIYLAFFQQTGNADARLELGMNNYYSILLGLGHDELRVKAEVAALFARYGVLVNDRKT